MNTLFLEEPNLSEISPPSFISVTLSYVIFFTVLHVTWYSLIYIYYPYSSNSKESACNAGHQGSIPGLGRSSGEGNDKPLQYSFLKNPMDRGACWATVCGVVKSRTWLSDSHTTHTPHTSFRKGGSKFFLLIATSQVLDRVFTQWTFSEFEWMIVLAWNHWLFNYLCVTPLPALTSPFMPTDNSEGVKWQRLS